MSHPEPGWKKVERRVAEFMSTVRTPLSGGNSGHTRSDTRHPSLFIEIKHGAGCPTTWPKILVLFAKTEGLADLEHKQALLVLHRKYVGHVEDYDTFLRIPTFLDPAGVVACVTLGKARELLGRGACPLPDPRQKKLDA